MSEIEALDPVIGPTGVIVREFQAELTEGGDGRTIEARIVPYDTPTVVADAPQYGGTGEPYEESWAQGAFDKQTGVAHRVKVWLNFEHEEGLRGIVGHAAELISKPDALYGVFRVHKNADGDKALSLVREGLLGGISLEARPLRTVRRGAVVERVRAHLDKVALVRTGAYPESQVLAVREAPELPDPDPDAPAPDPSPPAPEPEPSEPSDVELALKRVGFAPLSTGAVVRRSWDGSPSRFEDDEYEQSCIIDRGGDTAVKQRCSLPVLEPNGDVNAEALSAAAVALARGGIPGVTVQMKADAARKLLRYYRQAAMPAPPALTSLAAR